MSGSFGPGSAVSQQERPVADDIPSGLSSSSRTASSARVGFPRPEATLTVECTTGTPKVLMVLTVETAFLSRSS